MFSIVYFCFILAQTRPVPSQIWSSLKAHPMLMPTKILHLYTARRERCIYIRLSQSVLRKEYGLNFTSLYKYHSGDYAIPNIFNLSNLSNICAFCGLIIRQIIFHYFTELVKVGYQ